MTNLETVAAQRDEANARARELGIKLDAALKEIERLKGAPQPTDKLVIRTEFVPEVPSASPPKSKHTSIFGRKP